MADEKNAFYVVQKGDIVAVYKSLSDCHAALSASSGNNSSVSVFKGYRLPQKAEEYLVSHGLKNAIYSIGAARIQNDIFGQLVTCSSQQPASDWKKTLPKNSPQKMLQANQDATYHVNQAVAEVGNDENLGCPNELAKKVRELEKQIEELMKDVYPEKAAYAELAAPPKVAFPQNFVMPKFTKYDGTGPPAWHIETYKIELGAYVMNEELCVYLFPQSLTGLATRWIMSIDRKKLVSFKDVVRAFCKQYSYNNDLVVAPDRCSLQRLTKKEDESFGEYAARWRREAAQVMPPMEEDETVKNFVEIQTHPYFLFLVNVISRPFRDVIRQGKLVEEGLRTGKIYDPDGL